MRALVTLTFTVLVLSHDAAAADRLCDTAFEDCRAPVLELIRNERVGVDVAFWFMEDARYTAALARKLAEGVPVRVLVDPRANGTSPLNADRLNELRDAGAPMRRRTASGILHWKMMLFEGQNTVQFSAANYTSAFVPNVPYENYIDEVVYFSDDTAVVDSFRTKYDDLWTDDTAYADYANVTRPLVRRYPTVEKDPELNFPPRESYRSRAVGRYNAETEAIDVIMYRITDRAHTDAMIRAIQRGVPVRLITEPEQYRDRSRYWHSWNVDRLYAAGAQIRHRAHAGLLHQKSVVLRAQGLTIFGSSNWTSPSSSSQEEHNYFTVKPGFFSYFTEQFERKWNNATGHLETTPFQPLPPDRPDNVAPMHGAVVSGTTVTLQWNAGIWAHLYDVYFGTEPDPPLLAANLALGPSTNARNDKVYKITGLAAGTAYYWRVVAKTMALQASLGPVSSFGTAGAPPPSGESDIVLYAAHAPTIHGSWSVESDEAAAGGARLIDPDAGRAKVTQPLAAPTDYFELTFQAAAGTPYHLWLRGRADRDFYGNDSVHVQFSRSVSATGAPVFRIGTAASTVVCIEQGDGADLAGWGWADNGWDGLGPDVYFAESGPQTIRVQRREDGISIDQIILSPASFLRQTPGAAKADATIYPEYSGDDPPPGGGDGEQVLYASRAVIVGDGLLVAADQTAADGRALQSLERGAAKLSTALAAPATYAELQFVAEAGRPYRLWMRGRALGNYWGNDSIHVQFSDSVDGADNPVFRIGTAGSAVLNLEDCSGCGIRGWGWQDNGWGVGVLGPEIYFAATGSHTLRIQNREDGLAIDQVVLSPATYLDRSPGALKDDATILAGSGGP
jgi:phosphatidylserine/phosphatidylglycerophosphate/cardiolipin synthase-like enzyme